MVITIIGIIVALILDSLLASKASDIAEDKGYDKRTWFHMCFWLGLFSYIIIAAMPDRRIYNKLDKMTELLGKLVDKTNTVTAATAQPKEKAASSFTLPEI